VALRRCRIAALVVQAGPIRARQSDRDTDAGSITPLILGMTLCLMLLVAGITAAGSAFLAHNRLQNQCDGAALVAVTAAGVPSRPRAVKAANNAAIGYLAIRPGNVGVTVSIGDTSVTATCWATAEITFGAMFLTPTVQQTVTSHARLRLVLS
jgi:Flp pilus assembly protein TadG